MLLKRIQTSISSDLQFLIPLLGIKTTENILWTPRTILLDLLENKHQIQLDTLIEECLLLTSPSEQLGDEVLNKAIEGGIGNWEGFGLGGLDDILEEWDGKGVMEICGVSRVGKSLLALHAVLRYLINDPSAQARWLDADGSFQPQRARAILEYLDVENIKEVLDRLMISPCFRIEPDLYDTLRSIRAEESTSLDPLRTKIVVIDPIFNLLKDSLHHTSSQGHAAMISVLEEISEITHDLGLTTIVTNGVASQVGKTNNTISTFSTTTVKPALGASFTFFSDITLLVQETGKVFGMADEGERERTRSKPGLRGVVEVIKSRVTPVGDWTVFETNGISLLDVLPPPLEDERTIKMSAGIPVDPIRPLHGPLAKTVIP